MILRMENISKSFGAKSKAVKVIDNLSLDVQEGEILGLVGESGSGKSTIGRLSLKLLEADAGYIFYQGENITNLKESALKSFRSKAQIVFQDPFASLNPRLRVSSILGEALDTHFQLNKKEKAENIANLMKLVGLSEEHISRFPHEFSGGQRQRISIARALAVKPRFIVADEPVSALDVSVQAQILNLLQDLQEQLQLTILFISHDLEVVELICDRVAVLYLGKIMEIGQKSEIFHNAQHPYTKALLASAPKADPLNKTTRPLLKGEIGHSGTGCVFKNRCPIVQEICNEKPPELIKKTSNHSVACHF